MAHHETTRLTIHVDEDTGSTIWALLTFEGTYPRPPRAVLQMYGIARPEDLEASGLDAIALLLARAVSQ